MICREPFKCLNIINDRISSCCVMPAWVDDINFKDNPTLESIRQTWLQGKWPSACSICKRAEDAGKNSRRQSVEQWFTENNITDLNTELVRLDYWCGNMCNLRCPVCGPDNSVAWQTDLKQERNVIVNDRWKELDLSTLRWIHFNGGEPLLIDHSEFLEAIPNKSIVHLNYNTNGTIRPNEKLIDLWSQFKLVQIDFSIDGLDERFEFMRYPAKWSVVKDNLFWFREAMPVNFMFDINATVSILNVLTIHETEKWFKENYNTNRLGDLVSFRTQDAVGVLALDHNKQETVAYLDQLDKRRHTNWRSTFPEVIELLNTQ